jgi:hypothetical protein
MNLLGSQNFQADVPAGLASLLGVGVANGAARPVVADTARRETVYAT